MTAPARRPWWKKKRWAAASLLWLLVGYPASLGPMHYAYGRGWVSADAAYLYSMLYATVTELCDLYLEVCYAAGSDHAASD